MLCVYVCVAMGEQQLQSRLNSILNVIEDDACSSQEVTTGECDDDDDVVCLQSPAATALSAFTAPLCNLPFPHMLTSAQLS